MGRKTSDLGEVDVIVCEMLVENESILKCFSRSTWTTNFDRVMTWICGHTSESWKKKGFFTIHQKRQRECDWGIFILDICRDTAKFQTYAWRYCRSSFMPSDGWYFCDGGDSVKSQRIEHMFSQTAVCLMNVEVGQILPTILVGSFFPNKYGKPQIPIPIPNAELHERQWRTNLLHEHGSLSLVNTSNIQHLVPHQSAIPEKSQVPIVDSGQRRCDLVITLSLPRFFVRIVLGGSKFKYLCLLLLSCGHFATHRMVFGSM